MVKIYYADIRGIEPDPRLYPVSRERRERTLRYARPDDRARSIGAELLLNEALGRLFPEFVPPAETEAGAHGKPRLRDRERWRLPSGSPVEFNLSHSGDYAACAVGCGPLGIDIERARERVRPGILRFLAEEERQALEREPDPAAAFFDLWVLKESYMKAEGAGFSKAPSSFFIRREGGGCRVCDRGSWSGLGFRLFHLPGGYRIAVCAPRESLLDCGDPERIELLGRGASAGEENRRDEGKEQKKWN